MTSGVLRDGWISQKYTCKHNRTPSIQIFKDMKWEEIGQRMELA